MHAGASSSTYSPAFGFLVIFFNNHNPPFLKKDLFMYVREKREHKNARTSRGGGAVRSRRTAGDRENLKQIPTERRAPPEH